MIRAWQSRSRYPGAFDGVPRLRRRQICHWALCAASGIAPATALATNQSSRWFTTTDGVRLHYVDAGLAADPRGATLVFVPGWTMPGWIWQEQLAHFAPHQRVIAFDPRGQGRSAIAAGGYNYGRRAADIGELLDVAQARNVVLVGWSLGVLETLRYMHDARAAAVQTPVRAVVLVDNSVGEGAPPTGRSTFLQRLQRQRRPTMQRFVQAMFRRPVAQPWLETLLEAALRLPLQHSLQLLQQPTPREFWRDTLYAMEIPVLYAYTPRYAVQAELVKQRKPEVDTELFADAGHALFVDAADTFNQSLERFLARLGREGWLA